MIKRDVFRTPEGFNKNLSNVQNDEVCDARDDDTCLPAGRVAQAMTK